MRPFPRLTSCHLFREEGDELCEIDGTGCLGEHVGRVAPRYGLAHVCESLLQVRGADDAVLVRVHNAKCFLELLNLLLGEQLEDVRAAALGFPAKIR